MLQGRHGPEKGIHSPLRPSAQEPSWGGRSPFLLRTTHLPGGLRDVLPHLSRGSHMPSHLPSTHHYMSAPAVNTHRHRHVEHTQAHAHTQTHMQAYVHTQVHTHVRTHTHPPSAAWSRCLRPPALSPHPPAWHTSCDSFVCSGLMSIRLLNSRSSLMRQLRPFQSLIGRKQSAHPA